MPDTNEPRTAHDIMHARCGPYGADETIRGLRADLEAMRIARAASDQHLRGAIDERDKLHERLERAEQALETERMNAGVRIVEIQRLGTVIAERDARLATCHATIRELQRKNALAKPAKTKPRAQRRRIG